MKHRHTVRAVSGHYGLPTPPSTGRRKSSFKVPPPSTVRGYLESLMGLERGAFEGEIAIGILRPAGGWGTPLYSNTAYGKGLDLRTGKNKPIMLMRPYQHEIWYDVEYQIAVRGPMVDLLKLALRGEVERFGVLSLGTSDNEVYDIVEEEVEAQWIVQGISFPLPLEVQGGRANRQPVMGRFTLSPKVHDIPDTAWIGYTAKKKLAPKSRPKKPNCE